MSITAFTAQLDSDLSTARQQIAQARLRLSAAGLVHRAPPPAPTTCCGRGCNGCVWEGWFAAVQYWLEQADELLAQANTSAD